MDHGKKRMSGPAPPNFRPVALVIAAALFIALLTLVPSSGTTSVTPFACLRCGDRGIADLILNVVLFLPLGAALAAAGVVPRRAMIITLAFSASIELTQFALPGRSPTARDVFANAAGGWFGAVLMVRSHLWTRRGPHSVRLLWAATMFAVVSVAAGGRLLRPEPTDSDYYAQWAPKLGELEIWTGRVDEVTLGAYNLRRGRHGTASGAREALESGASLRIAGHAAAAPSALAPIFAIADLEQRHVIMVAQERDDIVVRPFRVSSRLRLDTPDIRFPDALAGLRAGVPLVIVLDGLVGLRGCISVNARSQCVPRFGAGSLWSVFVWNRHWTPRRHLWLGAFTMFALALPVALLLPTVSRTHAIVASLTLPTGIVVAAAATGLALPSTSELLALVLALAAGTMLSRTARPGRAENLGAG